MEVQGTVMAVSDLVTVSEKFKKRELIVQIEGKYPQDIMIEFHQDKCDLLNVIAEGEEVTVGINLRGRKWTNPETQVDRYFNTLAGWRITVNSGEQTAPPIPTPAEQKAADDLPF